jgi:predicted small integral membrane protein
MDMENEEDEFLMQNQRQKVLENFSEYRPGYSGSNPTKKSNSIDREYDNDRGLSYRTVSRSKYFQQPSKNNLDGTTITADRLKSIQNNRNSFIRTDRYEDKYNAKETQKPVTAKFEDTQGTLIEGKVIKSEKSQYAEVFKRSIPRKIFRICCMTILLIASFFVYSIAEWIMLKRRTYLHIASSHSLTVNITNCYIYLSNQGTVSDRLEINLTAHEEKLTPSVIFKANLVEESFSASGTTSTLSVQHSYRDYTCKLFITWPINTALTKLNVTCDMCTILAKGDVRIDQFYFKALDGFMNIRRLTSVLPLDIQVENGALQLNHFESTSLANVVSLNNGTVVVQTKEELAVELDGTNKAYCFSAPFVDTVSAVTCAVTPFTLYAQERKYEKTSYNRCTGVSNICQTVGCTPLRKIKFKSIAGSIFVNYLEGDTLTVKDSNTHVSGLLPSEQGLNLPTDISHFKEILTQQQKPGKVPLSLRIDVGNLKGESSSVARYVLSEYPINTNMPLWLIAGSTFGTYLTNHQEIDISLNPGFCPYKPKLSKKQ